MAEQMTGRTVLPLIVERNGDSIEIGTVEITVPISQIVLDDGSAVAVLGR